MMALPATPSRWIAVGAAWMAAAVCLGAFGAHALKARLSAEWLAVYQTGVEYHFYQALGLLVAGILATLWPAQAEFRRSAVCLLSGSLVFSLSLYVLAITGIRWLGAITPVGGVLMILGWTLLAWGVWRQRQAGVNPPG